MASWPRPYNGNKDWHKQVEKIIATLKNRLTVITNETAGYHVHVGLGRGPDARFKLTDLKKIAVVFIIYEKDIDVLHAPHRSIRINRSLPENIFLLSNRKYAFPRMSKGRIVKRIYRTKNISELQHLVNRIPEQELKDAAKSRPHRYYKINLLSLDVHRTVEFRQHAGTVNPEKICAWADFVLAVVSAAMSYSEDKLRDLVASGAALVPTFVKQELYDAVKNTAN
ncbi:hypothetical protein A0H81_09256 [Grifola frondosa]|uniref:Uncharacterized protein n=1 Tax=Grifola frondosa TaxID=5627 RepID=A0A1C7M251_GRIFR|nr:hypothetical protein A0H81_09256 [Grifola frondosa]